MEELARKYRDRDVEIFLMYVQEPHAGNRGYRQFRKGGFRKYRFHESDEHKMEVAKLLVKKHGLTIPCLVDGVDEKVHRIIGGLPNLVYVVNKEGEIVYKCSWTDADVIDDILAQLVTADDPSRPVQKTMDDRRVPGRIPVEV